MVERTRYTRYRTHSNDFPRPVMSAAVIVILGEPVPDRCEVSSDLAGVLQTYSLDRAQMREFCERFIAMDDQINADAAVEAWNIARPDVPPVDLAHGSYQQPFDPEPDSTLSEEDLPF